MLVADHLVVTFQQWGASQRRCQSERPVAFVAWASGALGEELVSMGAVLDGRTVNAGEAEAVNMLPEVLFAGAVAAAVVAPDAEFAEEVCFGKVTEGKEPLLSIIEERHELGPILLFEESLEPDVALLVHGEEARARGIGDGAGHEERDPRGTIGAGKFSWEDSGLVEEECIRK